jgi:hypothetical protein
MQYLMCSHACHYALRSCVKLNGGEQEELECSYKINEVFSLLLLDKILN